MKSPKASSAGSQTRIPGMSLEKQLKMKYGQTLCSISWYVVLCDHWDKLKLIRQVVHVR